MEAIESPFHLTGRTAVVAGAGSDIGAAIARKFAAAGARVVLGDIDSARLAAAAEPLGNAGRVRATDVTCEQEVATLVDFAVGEFAGIDVMVNLAGIIHDARVVDITESDLDRILAVNLKGVVFGCQAATRAMSALGGGSIVNMASAAAFRPIPELASYAMSKAGVVALTRVLAAEVGGAGIRVNAIAPGFVEGGMTTRNARNPDGTIDAEKLATTLTRARRNPLRTTGTPDDIANTALYLASDASRYLTGQVLHPNGGSHMP